MQPSRLETIGNDIVDLHAVEPPLHPRYLARVFTEREQLCIGESRTLLWLHWAAKEAAYKALKRLYPNFRFVPREIEFDALVSEIRVGDISLVASYIISPEKVYVSCNCNVRVDWIQEWSSEAGEDCDPPQLSRDVRALALEKISNYLSISAEHLTIVTDEHCKIPRLYLRGSRTEHLLSFAHHGRYVACAFLKAHTDARLFEERLGRFKHPRIAPSLGVY
ncbi:MAG: 4'-phosphopantetheinyl transferase superfamily protein [Deltaproteobacteria bacterium]|nr:4'-phosphopantetheinyl transferase superfamily protein [Deltaproteobacteria bacterium]